MSRYFALPILLVILSVSNLQAEKIVLDYKFIPVMDGFDEWSPKASQQLEKQGYTKLTPIESFVLETANSRFECAPRFTPTLCKKYPFSLYDGEKFVSLGDIYIQQFKEKKQMTFSIGTKKYQVDKLEKDGGVLLAMPFKGTKVNILLKPRAFMVE